jgi:[ribosomal protein S5]-alanine N-acetyltransferase
MTAPQGNRFVVAGPWQTGRVSESLPLSDGLVVLRDWSADDAGWYAAAVRDPQIQRFTSEPAALSARRVRTAIAGLRGRPDQVGFVICDALTGERLGNIALRRVGVAGEVSYWVAAPARGRGVATAALRLLSDWALGRLGVEELRLWCHADNRPSRRVAERAGYRRASPGQREHLVNGQVWSVVDYVRTAERADGP